MDVQVTGPAVPASGTNGAVASMWLWLGCLVLLALGFGAPARAQRAQIAVSASVVPRTVVEATTVSAVEISASDIERGYVESTATYRVRSNDRRGFLLQVRPRTTRAEAVQLGGSAQSITLGEHGVELHRPWRAGAQDILLRVRVRLDELVRPGRMELPVHVTFAAL
jgi:hypothetical protein